jgi:hypothetical protein
MNCPPKGPCEVKGLVSPPWLWLFGACGAGKTATGFELYRQLGAEGRRVGFIEIDQVGLRLPDDDPIRAPIKTENLVAALRNFHAVRAEGVIVSGDLAGPPMQQLLDRCRARPPALVRLRANPRESERRLRRRGAPPEYIEWSHSYDTHFDRDADVTIDTSQLTVAEAAARVRSELPAWPPPADLTSASTTSPPPHPALSVARCCAGKVAPPSFRAMTCVIGHGNNSSNSPSPPRKTPPPPTIQRPSRASIPIIASPRRSLMTLRILHSADRHETISKVNARTSFIHAGQRSRRHGNE